jgi:hypothetical protein
MEIDINGNNDIPYGITAKLQNIQQFIRKVQDKNFEFLPAHIIDLSHDGFIGLNFE